MNAIAQCLTARGMGAIAVIHISGADALAAAKLVCPTFHCEKQFLGRARRATAMDGAANIIDDALLLTFSPEHLELHLHGGVAVVDAVLTRLEEIGVRTDFTPGPTDDAAGTYSAAAGLLPPGAGPNLLYQEMLAALPGAATPSAVRLLTNQTGSGGLSEWMANWAKLLEKINAHDSAARALLENLRASARRLLDRSKALEFLLNPPRVAIIGPPNAGKSTLANALLGRPASITSNVPGATRDWVESTALIGHGNPQVAITLVDTAGVRETADALEQHAISVSEAQAAAADLLLIVLDHAQRPHLDAVHWLRGVTAMAVRAPVLVLNKCDLPATSPADFSDLAGPAQPVRLSALHHDGLEALHGAILRALELQNFSDNEPFLFTPRQRAVAGRLLTLREVDAAACALADLAANPAPDAGAPRHA